MGHLHHSSLSPKSRLTSPNISFKEAMTTNKCCLTSFENIRWHLPKNTVAWNGNEKYG